MISSHEVRLKEKYIYTFYTVSQLGHMIGTPSPLRNVSPHAKPQKNFTDQSQSSISAWMTKKMLLLENNVFCWGHKCSKTANFLNLNLPVHVPPISLIFGQLNRSKIKAKFCKSQLSKKFVEERNLEITNLAKFHRMCTM